MADAPQLFLASQKISRLKDDVPSEDRKGHVCEAKIEEKAWELITRDVIRQQIHDENPPIRKLIGLVCPAGEGKSTNMLWLQNELARPGSRQLPLLLDLRERDHLNLLAAERLSAKPSEALVNRLARKLHDLGGDHRRMVAEIQRYQKAGRITLLIDGLDHAPETMEINKEQRNLGLLIQEMLDSDQWKRCPVWISGRPTAFGAHWTSLFAKGDWKFRRVRQLEERDIRFYMSRNAGGDWYDEFVGGSGLLLAIPRFLHLICTTIRQAISNVSGDEARRAVVRDLKLRTPAKVYRRAFFHLGDPDNPDSHGLLAQGLHAENANKIGLGEDDEPDPDNLGIRVQRMGTILGAMAFEMLDRKDNKKKPQPIFTSIDVEPFLTDVGERMTAAGQGKDFRRDYRLLLKMNNQILDYLFLDQADNRQIGFRDRPTQAFFAAYWACNYEDKDKLKTTQAWVVDDLVMTNLEFREFWQFAAEFPDEALPKLSGDKKRIDPDRWYALFRPLYDGSVKDGEGPEGRPIRSTEFIYRSWPRMEGSEEGRKIIEAYRAEFKSIVNGDKGKIPQQIAQEMQKNFVLLGCNKFPRDAGLFTMGAPPKEDPDWDSSNGKQDNPQHEVELSPFRINRFCVTNLEYELFELRHKKYRWGNKEHPGLAKLEGGTDDLCPVVWVNWYDAFSFAMWTGYHLPTEAQWEYSCRGGAPKYQVFYFGDSLTSYQANFDGHYPFGTEEEGPYLKYTKPIKSYDPNAFALYNMHGNVREWCRDWYSASFYTMAEGHVQSDPVNEEEASARVLRGGSWNDFGGDCRSAFRYGIGPGNRLQDVGFRLAAVPELEPSQARKESEAQATEPSVVELK